MAWELVLRESAPNIACDLRKLFLRDSAAGLRVKALQAHVDTNGDAETSHSALLDSSAAVRQTARYYLRDICDKNYFAELYRGVITSRNPKNLATAAAGLGEVGSVFDAALLQSLLEASPRVARAALRSLRKLDSTGAHVTLMENLATLVRGCSVKRSGLLINAFLRRTPPSFASSGKPLRKIDARSPSRCCVFRTGSLFNSFSTELSTIPWSLSNLF